MSFQHRYDEDNENPFNISNDKYYCKIKNNVEFTKKRLNEEYNIPEYGLPTITHSLPAYDLWKPFFPTFISEAKLLSHHRPKLRNYSVGPQSNWREYHPVKNLTKAIVESQRRLRLKVIRDINKGMQEEEIVQKNFIIRQGSNLTAKRGELLLFEYCEEHPPILSQVGMASNIRTYFHPNNKLNQPSSKQKTESIERIKFLSTQVESLITDSRDQQSISTQYGYFEPLKNNCMKQLYYNNLKPGSSLQVIENNLYRAPVYKHVMNNTDFLIIRTRNSFYIRTVETIFTVGQTWPLVAVPLPLEKNVAKFRRDLALIHANNMMATSTARPKSINFKQLLRSFPDLDYKSFKQSMQNYGTELHYLDDYDKQNCVWYKGKSNFGSVSILEVRKRLTPEQYCLHMAMITGRQRLRSLNYRESAINEPNIEEQETEVKAAPWNISRAVQSASIKKCYLDLQPHLIDPSGIQCKEGFSCVQWPRNSEKLDDQTPPNKTKNIKENLKRLAIYQSEAQIISEIQHKVLSSIEEVSSDEDESMSEGEENKNKHDTLFDQEIDDDIEQMIINDKAPDQIALEKEERLRIQLLKQIHNGYPPPEIVETDENKKTEMLKITRRFPREHGTGTYQKVQIVRDPKVVGLYLKRRKEYEESEAEKTQKKVFGQVVVESNEANIQDKDSDRNDKVLTMDGVHCVVSKKFLDGRQRRLRDKIPLDYRDQL